MASTKLRIGAESRVQHVEAILAAVDRVLAQAGIGADVRHRIGAAAREATANAIIHGNHRHPARQVEVEVTVDRRGAAVRVVDEGAGFHPDAVRDPRSPENRLAPGGRGLLLMTHFADEVEFRFPATGGTAVTLRAAKADPPARKEQP